MHVVKEERHTGMNDLYSYPDGTFQCIFHIVAEQTLLNCAHFISYVALPYRILGFAKSW